MVTDQGFVSEPNVMWETLANVEGDSHFVDQEFNTYTPSSSTTNHLVHPTSSASAASNNSPSHAGDNATASNVTALDEQKQIDADLLVALTIQDEMDKAAAASAAAAGSDAAASSQNSPGVVKNGRQPDSQELADRQLAMALQEEEERLEAARNSREGGGGGGGGAGDSNGRSATGNSASAAERSPRSQPSSPDGDGRGPGQSRRPRQEKDKDCVIL